ncbi:MAG: SRPBCC domain-containing protein [Gemmatimonadota bacterium]|nr:SRPBCC domain-containing protein [Gemmatimonadota bacterium]
MFDAESGGTRYTAVDRLQHVEMGFHEGWGTVLDQLVEYAGGL